MIKHIKLKLLIFLMTAILAVGALFSPPVEASEPFVGQIMIFAGNFAPRGWAFCDGQLLAVSQNDALFSLLGTIYGGNGRTTFGLPDLRGRIPIHAGSGPGLTPRQLGSKGGAERVTLPVNQIPSHTHDLMADSGQGDTSSPGNNVLAYDRRERQYSSLAPDVNMAESAVENTGGSQAHENMPPYQALHYCIALFGVYPSRN